LKKTLNLVVIISLISVITFITLIITQINFYNSIIYLLISSSVLTSSISLKLLEVNPKIKLISILAIIINLLEFYALKTPGFLREFKWLTLTPLVILIGIAISYSMKSNNINMINKLGSFSTLVLTILLVLLTVFSVTSKWFFTLTFIFLITTTLSFTFSFLKKSAKE
jgi:hypothetical protein